MIWALLALLGIPLWFIAVALLTVIRNRRQVRSSPDVFAYVAGTDTGWSRRPGYARWVSDVLLVHRGPALIRTEARQVTAGVATGRPKDQPRKLGGSATALEFTFADRSTLRIAVDDPMVPTALGPFAGAD